ncbi:MAG: chromosome condensation and segregation ATPase [Bacillales bacterium]|jgi:chromosome segregation protein|nr:chromosome condensation and segregation ATPase [Bacillales bacterium]
MYLKRLEVVGFKSFAERINVDFVKGITGVVGPNGSGKSNVIDCIRWVLGEQSAKSLRGAKMEDIIFAGSESRKAVNMAEVTLVLDNQDSFLPLDFSEVSITRRVFRSGDSEYLINKQQCRLKDIVELFIDSGVSREAFSIISQGKVEEILSSKPEDRRVIFEEAAGVLKYKNRKKKAESKLQETYDNLLRIEDIVHELQGQIEPLGIQASIAKEYIDLKNDLEKFEVGLLVKDIESLNARWEESKSKLQNLNTTEETLATKIHVQEADLEKYKVDAINLDNNIDEYQGELLKSTQLLEKLSGQKELINERSNNASKSREEIISRRNDLNVLLKNAKESMSSIEDQYNELSIELNELKLNKGKLEKFLKNDNANIEKQIDLLKSSYIDKLNEQASSNNERNFINNRLQQLTNKKAKLEEENNDFITKREIINLNKNNILTDLSNAQHEIETIAQKKFTLTKEIENLRNEYSNKQTQLIKGYEVFQQVKSRKDTLEEMKEDFSGFIQGVKEVLKASANGKLKGVHGAIAEIINVDKKFEAAIDVALGSSLQNIVVTNEESARAAITYLKQTRNGRATFLPLNIIKPREINESLINSVKTHDSFIGIAANLISFDSTYSNVIHNLMGNVIIASDLYGANEIARKIQHRFRVVTLEGDVINSGGSMTGGTLKQASSPLLSRQRELDELASKIAELDEFIKNLEFKLSETKLKGEDKATELENTRLKLEDLKSREQKLKEQSKEIDFEERQLNDRLAIFDIEISQLVEETETLNNKIKHVENNLMELVSSIKGFELQISELEKQKETSQTNKEQNQNELTEISVKLAKIEQQLENLEAQKIQIISQCDNYNVELKKLDLEYETLISQLDNSKDFFEKLNIDISECQKHKDDITAKIVTIRQERYDIHQKISSLESDLRDFKKQQKYFLDQIKQEEILITRFDTDLENKLYYLSQEYEHSYESAKLNFPLEINEIEARKKVKLIKLSIDELGTVNLGAIDEYARVSERYKFLTDQKADLLEADSTLRKVIDEMDEEMERRFSLTFESIKKQFGQVFSQLFGGGSAELVLTDPKQLLSTGIEIIAQPPGKKLQSLSLMSGGERALTAIALLFSILKVRPVPFCILDEVEAALDEANVSRFANYLKQFSNETQFIVITHRKGTMEETDVLYGITMQESGVSKVVSVRLEEMNEIVEEQLEGVKA